MGHEGIEQGERDLSGQDVSGRRVVVTGGAGFIGSWMCERLLDLGAEVVCVDNYVTGTAGNTDGLAGRRGFTLVQQDVSAGLDVDGPVDWVLHLACPASPVHYLRLPVETLHVGSLGTMNAIALAEAKGARLLLASTSEVYGDPLEHPQRESYWGNVNPIGPRSVYDESKRFSEALVAAHRRARDLDACIARIFNSYGPRMRTDDGRAIPAFMWQALHGQPITVAGDGSQTRSVCYVEDTVAGLLALVASGHAGPVNIGNEDEMTVLELAQRIKELTGSRSEIVFVDRPADDPKQRRPDIALARELLGWSPEVTPDEGLKRTLDWFSDQVRNDIRHG